MQPVIAPDCRCDIQRSIDDRELYDVALDQAIARDVFGWKIILDESKLDDDKSEFVYPFVHFSDPLGRVTYCEAPHRNALFSPSYNAKDDLLVLRFIQESWSDVHKFEFGDALFWTLNNRCSFEQTYGWDCPCCHNQCHDMTVAIHYQVGDYARAALHVWEHFIKEGKSGED